MILTIKVGPNQNIKTKRTVINNAHIIYILFCKNRFPPEKQHVSNIKINMLVPHDYSSGHHRRHPREVQYFDDQYFEPHPP